MLMDEHGIPYGWEDVHLTEEEMDEMCDALDAGDEERAEAIVEGAYEWLFMEVG